MDIAIGGDGRAITDVSYSRNISPQWNFGFDFKGGFEVLEPDLTAFDRFMGE